MEKEEKYSEEDLAIGQVYKQLRLAKGLTQVEAANGRISITHLSSFENGKTIIASHHFLKLLENINVSMFEFQNTLNLYLEERDLLLFSLRLGNAVTEKNRSKLKQLLKEIEGQLTSLTIPNKKKRTLDYLRVKAALSFIDNSYSFEKDEKKFLTDYLFNLKEWGQYDMALLGQCAKFIDWYPLVELTNSMISPSQSSLKIPYVKQAMIQNLLNVIDILLQKNLYEPAKKFIDYLYDLDIIDYYMFEKLTLIYIRAKYDLKKGDISALERMRECEKTFEFSNCHKTANWMHTEITELEKEFSLPTKSSSCFKK